MRTLKLCLTVGLIAMVSAGLGAKTHPEYPENPPDWRGTPGWEPEGAYCRLYNVKTVVTLKGTVQTVEKINPMKGMGSGTHLILDTRTEIIPVHLGPTWFMEKQSVQIQPKDVIEVTGSRVTCDGKPVILAATVKKGSDVLKVRNAKGSPAWTIWPPKSQ